MFVPSYDLGAPLKSTSELVKSIISPRILKAPFLSRTEIDSKTYWGAIAQFLMFSMIGIVHLLGVIDGIADLWIGLFCITGSLLVLHFATKEYYKIRGSMILLQKLLKGEEIQSEFTKTESKFTV